MNEQNQRLLTFIFISGIWLGIALSAYSLNFLLQHFVDEKAAQAEGNPRWELTVPVFTHCVEFQLTAETGAAVGSLECDRAVALRGGFGSQH